MFVEDRVKEQVRVDMEKAIQPFLFQHNDKATRSSIQLAFKRLFEHHCPEEKLNFSIEMDKQNPSSINVVPNDRETETFLESLGIYNISFS